ncbi:hypothetical protein IJ579_09635 [bacterium]|nr:hypothetical protein [bacterium]
MSSLTVQSSTAYPVSGQYHENVQQTSETNNNQSSTPLFDGEFEQQYQDLLDKYEDDVMMPKEWKTPVGEEESEARATSDSESNLQEQTSTASPESSRTGQITGAVVGASVPLVQRGYQLLKGAKLTEVCKAGPMAFAMVGLGLLGWGAGSICDKFADKQKAVPPETPRTGQFELTA